MHSTWGVDTTGEEKIKELLKEKLREEGYEIVYCGTREGPDIVLLHRDRKELVVVEVRGIPTKYCVKGKNKGKLKEPSTIRGQFWGWVAEVIIELMEREQALEDAKHGKVSEKWVEKLLNELRKKGLDIRSLRTRYWGVFGKDQDGMYREYIYKKCTALERLGYEVLVLRLV